MNTKETAILERVRILVHEIDPEANVILYGSHARGEAGPDSDWDILIVTENLLSWEEEQKLRSLIYRYEVDSDQVLSLVIHSKVQWADPLFQETPFYRNVTREGINI